MPDEVEATTEPTARVGLREITEDTVVSICQLSDTLSEVQKRMVASNAQSIAQAYFNKHAWFRAIYAGETPVGFLMLSDDPDMPEYFLWRLMIAGPYQGLGHGRQAIGLLIDYVKTRPGAKELLVSCEEGEGSPEGFYARLGFARNGLMLGEEVVMRLDLREADLGASK